MAKVWKVQGSSQRGPAVDIPWEQCRDFLEIDDLCRTEDRPKFEGDSPGGIFTTHVVVQMEPDEAEQQGIKPGFFVSPLDPHIAEERLERYKV